MNKNGKLIQTLWSLFLAQIRTGLPVYFSFHRDLLIRAFEQNKIGHQDPLYIINEVVKEFIEIDDDMVIVNPDAFDSIIDGFSAVIILVAQQILVVEEMVKDRDGFSEDAYFPRLRRAMSEQLSECSQHPFASSDDFEAVWRKFQSEIFQAGGRKSSITFSSGKFSNRNRSYPLSQALLSQEDVFKLIRIIGPERIFNVSDHQLALEVKRVKTRISRRGQKTLGVPFLADRVYQQIVSYKKVTIPQDDIPISENESNESVFVRVYKDQVDIFDEEYRIGFFNSGSFRIHADVEHRKNFRLLVRDKKCVFLFQTSIGDSWITSSDITEVVEGESLAIISDAQGRSHVEVLLKRSFPTIKLSNDWVQISSFGDLFLMIVDSLPQPLISFKLRDGKPQYLTESNLEKEIIWVGGVCIDARTRKYLLRFLPSRMIINGNYLSMTGPVKINGRITTFEVFLDSLKNLKTEERFDVELNNRFKGFFSVGVAKENTEERRGYLLANGNLLSASVEEIPLGLQALQGFTLEPVRPWLSLKTADIALLLQITHEGWFRLTEDKITLVNELILKTDISIELKKLILLNIQKSQSVPDKIASLLKIDY